MAENKAKLSDYGEAIVAECVIGLSKILPYAWRVPAIGWLTQRVIAPLAGWNTRVRENLAMIHPDMAEEEVQRICRGATDNAGRAIIETYSPKAFIRRNKSAPLVGPGLEALKEARAAGRPVIVVTGHFGNYDALAVAMAENGFPVGVLYRRLSNPVFNARYESVVGQFCETLFATDRRGLTQLLRHLKAGRIVGMNLDVNNAGGVQTQFLGHPAMTAPTPAEWAMKHNALLLPVYSIRQDDGLSFEIFVDTPIEHNGDATAMVQAINDSLGRLVEKHPEQWFWIHRRWKDA